MIIIITGDRPCVTCTMLIMLFRIRGIINYDYDLTR